MHISGPYILLDPATPDGDRPSSRAASFSDHESENPLSLPIHSSFEIFPQMRIVRFVNCFLCGLAVVSELCDPSSSRV